MEEKRSTPMLELLREAASGRQFRMPLAEHLGFHVVQADPGTVTIELKPQEMHHNIAGTLHGGVLCVIADSAMGLAFGTTVEAGQTFTTVEQKVNVLRPVFDKTVQAKATVIQRGRTLGLIVCRITDSDGKLVAFATSTYAVLDRESAQGREIKQEFGGRPTDG